MKRNWFLVVVFLFSFPIFATTVKFVTGDFYPPFIWISESGEPVGISIEILKLLEKKTNLTFDIEVLPFHKALEKILSNEADMINLIFKTTEREKYLVFTDPVFTVNVNVYYRQNIELKNHSDIIAHVVGAVKGDASVEIFKTFYPKATLVYYENFEDLIKSVKNNELNVFVMEDFTARYYLVKYDLFHKFKSLTLQSQTLHFAFPIAKRELATTINKLLKDIKKSELKEITSLFIPTRFHFPKWLLWLIVVLLVAVASIIGILTILNHYLKKLVERRTVELKKAYEEMKAANDEIKALNEQLTANNAELEAMNQELISQNQELNALNEELSQKNKELEKLHSENAKLQNLIFDVLEIFSTLLLKASLDEEEFFKQILKSLSPYEESARVMGILFEGPPFIICLRYSDDNNGSRCERLKKEFLTYRISSLQELSNFLKDQVGLVLKDNEKFFAVKISALVRNFGYLFCVMLDDNQFLQRTFEKLGISIAYLLIARDYIKEEGLFHKRLILFAVRALESYDKYTKGHSENVARYSSIIAEKMGLPREDIRKLYWAGLVHDIGKIFVPQHILNKNGFLDPQEYELVKLHPVKGYEWLLAADLPEIAVIVRHHHERYDGKGYPDGLKGEDIPLLSRILCVADSFDAMTTDRPYRKALTLDQAKEELLRCSGTQFDPKIVPIVLEIIDEVLVKERI
ncbi:HD domain-containing phosphohydrolase [Pseudothermotoga thermarum]|uniref:Metal dependent phosphohydrolase n=1 Tax=Pseudothermotoga thermarum DSM 5069 TaxID=688269 RepID=F7YVU6_9THEM|nr:HD domain-containing phosphohydrolase [Pseudothermotoga thermarum]AEH51768.1 metal dependent phosphohydrolase [Pseudothermotoga thermarum DSM 5069]